MLSSKASAIDFGIQGQLFEIEETDMLDYIQNKLQKMEESGELKKAQEAMKVRAIKTINEPKAVDWLKPTEKHRKFFYDPTYTLDQDIYDHEGTLIHPKGTTVNPFDKISLYQDLLFIDGNSKKQIEWSKSKEHRNPKVILVKGSPVKLMKACKCQIYFDQQEVLVNKFGIKHIPAKVYQEGKQLAIEEIVVGE